MEKKEVIKQLNNMNCDIAEIICDIKTMSGEWNNESVLVFLTSQPCNDDFIDHQCHWCICESIKEFSKHFAFNAKEAKLKFQNCQITNVIDIREFVADL